MARRESNILMVSADRSVVAGERGPFYYMLEAFRAHWDRIDVIGTRPDTVASTQPFDNVHLHHPTTGKLRQAAFIARTGQELAGQRPYAVITSHDYNPFYNGLGSWAIARRTGIPYVSEIHHVPGHPRAANARERVDRHLTRHYVRWARRRAAGFRVVNRVELPELLASWGVPGERIHVLPSLYLDHDVFTPGAKRVPPECDLLFVGRLVPSKGLDSLLEAFRVLVAGGLDLRLRLIGRGPVERRLRAFTRRHGLDGCVDLVPWVPDAEALATAYRRARLLVCTSLSEGGPRVVPEALACGTPVVSTRVGLVPELVRDGVDGALYDGSTAGLVAVLRGLFGHPDRIERMAAALPPPALAGYRREDVIARLAEGLRAIAASSARARGP